MAIVFSCACGKQLQAKDEFGGRRIRCPKCQAILTIPGGDTPASPGPNEATPLPSKRALPPTAAASPWFDNFLGQRVTPWRAGDEMNFQKGVVPPREGPHPLVSWLLVLVVVGALGAAGVLWFN